MQGGPARERGRRAGGPRLTAAPDLQRRDLGPVRELAIHNPDRRNALTEPLLDQLDEALAAAAADGVRCLLLRGAGPEAFSSGYDVSALSPPPSGGPSPDAHLLDVLRRLEDLPIAVVAYLNGSAFGGGLDLAACCDIRVAASAARLGMPPARLGIAYATEGLARFSALMGQGRARRLFFSGEALSATQALEAGLVDEVWEPPEAERRCLELCQTIAANAPRAVALMKRQLTRIARAGIPPIDPELESLRQATFASDDAREGMTAFLEKRPPRFQGR